jgi:hypothetical protein
MRLVWCFSINEIAKAYCNFETPMRHFYTTWVYHQAKLSQFLKEPTNVLKVPYSSSLLAVSLYVIYIGMYTPYKNKQNQGIFEAKWETKKFKKFKRTKGVIIAVLGISF